MIIQILISTLLLHRGGYRQYSSGVLGWVISQDTPLMLLQTEGLRRAIILCGVMLGIAETRIPSAEEIKISTIVSYCTT